MSSPTIRELAKIAGVSRTTVSLALRNHPRISAEVRDKVIELAQECGYQRDPVVSALMNQLRTVRKSRSVEKIAYLTFWDSPEGWKKNLNESDYFSGACDRASQFGYEVETFWAKQPGLSGARLSKILYARGIRGVLLAPLPRGVGHVSLNWPHFACATLGLTVLKPELHRATHNYIDGMQLALHSLKKLGYRRIAFANMAIYEKRTNHGWISGFLTWQYHAPAHSNIPPYLVPGIARDTPWDKDLFARWLEKWKPDAIVSNTEQPLYLARELGYRVPDDLGYASLHRLYGDAPWAGVDRQPKQIGAAGMDLVISQLQNNESGLPACPKTVSIKSIWRDGPTICNKLEKKTTASKRRLRRPSQKTKASAA